MLTLTGLRCEYAPNPLGIDSPHPRLSWVAAAEGGSRNQRITAYQVLAASSPEGLEGAAPDLWNSGKVATSSSAVQVEYAGRPLGSRQRVYWKVRAWDENDQPGPYSAPAWFEMGLLDPADWKARNSRSEESPSRTVPRLGSAVLRSAPGLNVTAIDASVFGNFTGFAESLASMPICKLPQGKPVSRCYSANTS